MSNSDETDLQILLSLNQRWVSCETDPDGGPGYRITRRPAARERAAIRA